MLGGEVLVGEGESVFTGLATGELTVAVFNNT